MDVQKMSEARSLLIEWGFPAENATLMLTSSAFNLTIQQVKSLYSPSHQEPSCNSQQQSESHQG